MSKLLQPHFVIRKIKLIIFNLLNVYQNSKLHKREIYNLSTQLKRQKI